MRETVFITGAAGMMGQHLLQAICANEQVEKALVLVHRTPLPISHRKIEAVPGDATVHGLGLEQGCAKRMARHVTTIIHGAADTSFSVALPAARKINVAGTENVFQFAGSCTQLRAICHLSTLYVAGRRTGTIRESDFDHDRGFVNAYEQSKYEAELVARSWSAELPVSIVRLSTILGDSRDGAPTKLGGIHHALRFFFHSLAPFVPGTEESPVDLIALDYAAEAVVALALSQFTPSSTRHICGSEDSFSLGGLLDLSLQLFSENRPAWRQRSIARPAIVKLETFERFAESVESLGEATLSNVVNAIKHFAPQMAYPKMFNDCETQRALQQAGLRRPRIADFYPKVISYLLNHNWQPARCAAL